MPTAVVLQHVSYEGPGTIADAAARAGWTLDVRHLYQGDTLPAAPKDADAVIVMGGPMNVDEVEAYPYLVAEDAFLREALAAETPLLGFCLGSQLLAKAGGASVMAAGIKEIGWYHVRMTEAGRGDPLLEGLDEPLTVFHWHGDTFTLPADATLICTSIPVPNQAFRLGTRAYGFQFHLEVTAEMVREWLEVNAEELVGVRAYVDPAGIRSAIPQLLPRMQAVGDRILDRWFQLAAG